MPRLTLKNCRDSRLPEAIGACFNDTPAIAAAVNAAQQRLVFAKEAGDEGWFGSWARMVFNVLRSDPYITLGRWGSRMMNMTVCRSPVAIQNDFFEFLQFGNGLQPKYTCGSGEPSNCGFMQGYVRGEYPSFVDLGGTGRLIRVRALDTLDTNGTKRVLIQGTDEFDRIIYSLDGYNRITGQYLTIAAPFVDMPQVINTLTGIQKDVTNGQVQFWDVDPVTAVETLILTMEPSETVSGYRRYYLQGLPVNCCPVVNNAAGQATVQIEALVKLNLLPVAVDSDYLLLQNLEAVIAECQSMRYSTMDLPNAKVMSAAAHRDAIRLLNGEINHHYGITKPAVSFAPFGSACLERQAIGTMI